jgi:Zn finger protein HypA/HybF involved in hydrogenase expression
MDAVQTFRCEGCGAALTVVASERTQVCPSCASPNVSAGPGAQSGSMRIATSLITEPSGV